MNSKKTFFLPFLCFLFLGLNRSATAQQEAASTIPEQLKQGMISLCKEIISIAGGITKVADVDKAEPRIAGALNGFTSTVQELAATLDNVAPEDLMGIETIMDDAELQSWNDKTTAAIDDLKAKNAEAAAKLEDVTEKYSEGLRDAVGELMTKMMQKISEDMIGSEGIEPEEESAE